MKAAKGIAKKATQGKGKTAGKKAAKSKKAAAAPAAPKAEAGPSKQSQVLDLLKRKGGATSAEIATATGWQFHTIRGFVSGTVQKKLGHQVKSERNADGQRCYEILQ